MGTGSMLFPFGHLVYYLHTWVAGPCSAYLSSKSDPIWSSGPCSPYPMSTRSLLAPFGYLVYFFPYRVHALLTWQWVNSLHTWWYGPCSSYLMGTRSMFCRAWHLVYSFHTWSMHFLPGQWVNSIHTWSCGLLSLYLYTWSLLYLHMPRVHVNPTVCLIHVLLTFIIPP